MNKVIFDSKTHTYRCNGALLPSVTKIIGDILPLYKINEWYLQRGSAVHMCAKYIAEGKSFSYDPRIDGQVKALNSFFKTVKPVILNIEMVVWSAEFQYAGTLDLLCELNKKICIIDYKGTLDEDRVGLQLGGYSNCLANNIDYGYGVEIREDGTFKMSNIIRLSKYRREFLALRTAYAIRERNGYHK